MKNIVLGFFALGFIFMFSCNSESKKTEGSAASSDSAIIKFEKTVHDFGTINEGDTVSTTYKFKNVGQQALEIYAVEVSCGCTVAEKPEKPVGVGQSSEIKINFNSKGKSGINRKFITVISNATIPREMLEFTVIVNTKEETNK
jgi:hypothetical protein